MAIKINIIDPFVSVVSSFGQMVDDKHIITFNNDLIYSKGFGGSMSASFKPAHHITDEEFAVYDVTEFFNIYEFMDKANLEISLNDNVIELDDKIKTVHYLTCPVDYAPQPNLESMEAIRQSKDVKAKIVLDDADIELGRSASSVTSFDKLYLKLIPDQPVKFIYRSTVTDNKVEIPIKKSKSLVDQELLFELPDVSFFKVLYDGIYQVEVKGFIMNDLDFTVLQMNNMSVKNDEHIESLQYTVIIDDEV